MNMYNLKFVYFNKLDLGKEYIIHWNYSSFYKRVKLIKCTAKGYNFLNIETNKCVLKRHMYINKSGFIVLPKSFKLSNFEFEVQGSDRIIKTSSVIN